MAASFIRTAAAELARQIPLDECGIVSITDVVVSSDLSFAKVYVSALKDPLRATKILAKRKGELRAVLAKRLSAHHVPTLQFLVDERTERGNRLDELLK